MTIGAARLPSANAADAFTPIYRRHATDVYRYSLALLGNPSDAEDATQTAFLNAYRAYRRGERPREPLNWLIAIAHNACLERRRRAQRRPEEVPLDGEARGAPVVDPDQVQEVRELLDALATLPFGQRAALVLREVGGRSYDEIAEMLGTSVKAVDMALMRARRALRRRRASLGALTAVEAPARLWALATSSGLAQAAGLVAPIPLGAKVAAAVVAAVIATVPLAESVHESSAMGAPAVARTGGATSDAAGATRAGGASGAAVGARDHASSALALAASGVRRVPDAADLGGDRRARSDHKTAAAPGTDSASVARGGTEAGSPSAASGAAARAGGGTTDRPAAAPSQGGAQGAASAPTTEQAAATATAPVQQAAAPVTTTVQTTTTTVTSALPTSSPSVAVPSAPVAAPSAPVSSPVSVPSVPQPSLPSVPTVSAPTLPPPPPAPSLPSVPPLSP